MDLSLVARTLDLYERIHLFRRSPSSFTADETSNHRLARWEQAFASLNDPGAFDRRLAFDGFDRASILPVLGRVALPDDHQTPAWLDMLRTVREEMKLGATHPRGDLFAQIPFGDYWEPWVAAAKRRVAGFDALSEKVRRALEHGLFRDLAQSGTQCLMHEFDLDRIAHLSANDLVFSRMAELRGKPASAVGTDRYRRFIEALHGPRADGLFERYPCLARLAATRVLQWSRHVGEILARLERDRPEVGDLVDISADVADSHNGGRSVAILHFSSGKRVVYKPKDLATEHAFQTLASAINALGFSAPLKTLKVISREGYGWVEWVPASPCETDPELRAYYTRCGALVALVTLLHGADCHFENIIADGDQPVLIDHEVLLCPRPRPDSEALRDRLESSVLRTSLLPEWSVELDGKVIDLSGIGATPSRRVTQRVNIANMNSDEMTFEMTADVPVLETRTPRGASAGDFEAEVIAGFQEVHRLLLALSPEKRIALFAPFSGIESRHVVRGTVGYAYLQRDTRRADLMVDGLERALTLDRIARTFVLSPEKPAAWAIVEAEHEALLRGDVPSFVLRSDSRGIFVRDPESGALRSVGENVFAESGFDGVTRALRDLSEEDTALETALIEASFSGKAAGIAIAAGEADTVATPANLSPFDDAGALAKALAIARTIARTTFRWRGKQHRVGLLHDEKSGTHQVALFGPELYTGSGGIALFLAAAGHLANDDDLRRAALDTIAPHRSARAFASLGGFDGAGGVIYGFARLSRLTGDPSLVDDARAVADAITREDLDRAALHDVFGGTAGLLLALVTLDGASPALIEACGRRILRAARPQAAGIGWPMTEGSRALCGLAHGNAGIAMALMEAWRRGGPRDFRDAAEQALVYERSVRLDDNWPDLRERDNAPSMSTWCNGAPGMLLARTRLLAIDDVGNAREDVELALRTTRDAVSPAAHLCCGMAGIDEILFEVGRRNADAALTEVARRRAFSRIDIDASRVVSQSLMRGSAGLGFLLLRMTEKGRDLASVLDLSV